MDEKKKIYLLIGMLSFVSLIGISFVHADDGNERESEGYVQPAPTVQSNAPSVDTSSSSNQKMVTIKKTIIIEPAKIVTEDVVQDVVLPDSDMDGIPDEEDSHPNVAEIYIVNDDNNNGIVDTFENTGK